MPRDEANIKARDYLKRDPDATARDVSKAVGCALGQVPKLPAWRAVQDECRKGRKPMAPKAVSLTRELQANIDDRGKIGRRIAMSPTNDEAAETLETLIADQESDYEPSPLDKTESRPRQARRKL